MHVLMFTLNYFYVKFNVDQRKFTQCHSMKLNSYNTMKRSYSMSNLLEIGPSSLEKFRSMKRSYSEPCLCERCVDLEGIIIESKVMDILHKDYRTIPVKILPSLFRKNLIKICLMNIPKLSHNKLLKRFEKYMACNNVSCEFIN